MRPLTLLKIEALTVGINQLGRDFAEIQLAVDDITQSHTTFASFAALLHAPAYRPSLLKAPEGDYDKMKIVILFNRREVTAELRYAELDFLALCYDMAQRTRGDSRRAYRS